LLPKLDLDFIPCSLGTLMLKLLLQLQLSVQLLLCGDCAHCRVLPILGAIRSLFIRLVVSK